MSWASRVAVGVIRCYQMWLSPLLGFGCRFAPTCSEYARIAVMEHGLLVGAWLALGRLLRCHPFHPGGVDVPPPARRARA